MAYGRMSGERTRQLDYATIGKTEVALNLKFGCLSASERWEGLHPEMGERNKQWEYILEIYLLNRSKKEQE